MALFGSFDGKGSDAKFETLQDLALDSAGNVFVTEPDSHTLRRISPDGVVTTVGGLAHNSGSVDGVGRDARFSRPAGVAIDRFGTLFVGESMNHTVRIGTLEAAEPRSSLANLSVRSIAGTGGDTLIVGFNLAGPGTKRLLLRGIGPGLTTFGVPGVLADPTLRLDASGGRLIAENNDWTASGEIASAAAAAGAFPLASGSKDSALLATVGSGGYTAQIGGGEGAVLVEAYDSEPGAGPKLTNLAARTRAGMGDILIAGFTIAGSNAKTVLIRAVGPSLTQFGVSGAMVDPRLQLFRGPMLLAENDDWTSESLPGASLGASALNAAFGRAGAFSLALGSKDAALLIPLPAGSYTIQASGVGRATGVILVEIYELDL